MTTLASASGAKPERVWLLIRHAPGYSRGRRDRAAREFGAAGYVQTGHLKYGSVGPVVELFIRRAA